MDYDGNLMSEYIIDKLSGDGHVEVLEVNGRFEFTATFPKVIHAGQKLSIVMPHDVHITTGNTLCINIKHVVIE